MNAEEQVDVEIDMNDVIARNVEDGGTSALESQDINAVPHRSVSKTAFVMDAWSRRKGKELRKAGSDVIKNSALTDEHMADCFHAAFDMEPHLAEECQSPEVRAFFEALMQTPDFEKTRECTMLDVELSEMATASYAAGLIEVIKVSQDAERQQTEGTKPGERKADPNAAAQRQAARCARQAQQQVQQQQDVYDALGIGTEAGGKQDLDRAKLKKLHKKIRGDETLRRICERAGRFRRAAQSAQRNKTTHGMDEVVGIELSGDVARLLPHELALLDDEDFGDDTMRRLAERECQSREVKSSEKVAKGPIIVSVDESGSMNGDRIYNAKAFALAMAQIASMQKRWCVLQAWSTGPTREIVLKPGQWPALELVDWLCSMIGGGTEPPLMKIEKKLIEWQAPKGKTDMILLTDGECNRWSEEDVKRFQQWKSDEKLHLITLLIEMTESDALAPMSDRMHGLPALDPDAEGINAAFSV